MSAREGVIGILTGGGDVPGLNPAIRAVTIRALREGYHVIGIRRGWQGTISIVRDAQADNSENFQILTEEIVNRARRTGGTFLHTSRTNPSAVKKGEVPEALRATFDQEKNVSEGAMFEGGEMVLSDRTTDAYGHMKLGGIGDLVSAELKERGPKYNKGKPINVINQRLGYMVRGGDPDAIDSIVPMAYGNLALDLILRGMHGRLVVLKNGRYDNMPIEVVTSTKKTVNVEKYYNKERLRPLYTDFEMQPLFIMASD